MSISSAFKFILKMRSRSTILQKDDYSLEISIMAARSNYSRKLEGPESTIVEGHEIVIHKDGLGEFGKPKRGDRFIDEELGEMIIDQVIPLIILGGENIGYRIRCI